MRVRAAWVLPIASPPVRDGVVTIADGRIVGVGPADAASASGDVHDLGDVALLPGLVNAHTHLELSWMRGRVPASPSMIDWVRRLLELRAGGDDPAPVAAAVEALRASGTVAVGDVGNTTASWARLRSSRLHGVLFHELIGFADGEREAAARVSAALEHLDALEPSPRLRPAIAAHAPYSVSPALFRAAHAAAAARGDVPFAVHVGESAEECTFLSTGQGGWREVLDRRDAWNPGWQPPRCRPVEYLDRLGVLGPRTLIVHGVQCDDDELRIAAARGATLVTCPRSNEWVGAGSPPIERFYRSGVRVAIGTDSLASVPDLNLFAELARMRALAPSVPARRLIESATRSGAVALGLEASLGAIAPGLRAALIAVRLPHREIDVEEFLVSGVAPEQVRHVPEVLS